MRLMRAGRFGVGDEAGGHEAREHSIERAGARRECATGFGGNDVLDRVAVQRAAGERQQHVILEEAHTAGVAWTHFRTPGHKCPHGKYAERVYRGTRWRKDDALTRPLCGPTR